jgi:hypothetical protein
MFRVKNVYVLSRRIHSTLSAYPVAWEIHLKQRCLGLSNPNSCFVLKEKNFNFCKILFSIFASHRFYGNLASKAQ